MLYSFSGIEIYYPTFLITVCSKTSIQQKRLPTSLNNVIFFFSYEKHPTSVINVFPFPSYGDRLLNIHNLCMQ